LTDAVPKAHALGRLTALVETFSPDKAAISIRGTVTEVAYGYCNVAGLGRHVSPHDILIGEPGGAPLAEVVHANATAALAVPYRMDAQLKLGGYAFRQDPLTIAPTRSWFGRVVNAFGEPIDGLGPIEVGNTARTISSRPPPPLRRRPVSAGVSTGVKAIDIFTPLCVGQRIGIFAGSGVGKSTLLGMLTMSPQFDVIVVGLIGERGREVREFVDNVSELRTKPIVIVAATGDESPLLRRTAAHTTMAIAEHFRDEGNSVLLILDSVTRFALACREIAVAAGEPPVSRGFPPSVFTDLPRLLERAGPGADNAGDITGIFSVLVDGDDHNDPIADAVRGIVDGHIVLDRSIAAQGRYPAIDIPISLSRLSHLALTPERQALARRLRALVGRFEEARDLRAMGGYQPGNDIELDTAVAIVPLLYSILNQSGDTPSCPDAFQEVANALKTSSLSAAQQGHK